MRTYQIARGSGMKLEYQVMDAGNKLINVSSSSSSTPDIINVLLEAKETIPCTSDTSKLMNDKIDTVKLKSLEENNNMEQTLRDCQDLTRDTVIHSDDEKNDVSLTSNCVKEVNGKPKRNDQQSCSATKKMRTKRAARGSGIKLVVDAGNKLINVSSSTPDILNVLSEIEKVLSWVQQSSEEMIKALHPIIQPLSANGLVRHPDMNVNISVVCCICQVIRIMGPDAPPYDHQQMKEFFEVVVTLFEKQSCASGSNYGKLNRVLRIFSKTRLPVMMLDLQLEELVGRLFKQFLTFPSANNLLKMEKIMTMIIEESGEALALEALINTILEKTVSPICWQLGQKVLKNCDAKLRSHRTNMAQDEAKGTNPCTSDTNNLKNDTTHKTKLEPLEETIKMEQTLSGCQDSIRDGITINSELAVSFDDPLATSNCVTEVNGKRKRHDEQEAKGTNHCTSDTSKLRNDATHKINLEPLEETINTKHTLSDCQDSKRDKVCLIGMHSNDEKNAVSFDDPSVTPYFVTEVNGKRKRNDEQKATKKVLYSLIRVQGYKIKKSNAPILEAIFKKHGDIASNCVVKTASVRESILEVICEVVKRIQTDDFKTIISDMEEIEMKVLDAEATNMNVTWLRTHLESLHKKNTAQKRSSLHGQMKANTSLVKRAAKMDLEERRIELVTAQEEFKKAERCVQVLDLVETKMNNDFLESEAEKESWLNDSVL
ncbi:uncharacterized protein [Rutidosis leptorrhynchoides]|uniref:uncharacterized protein isoform X2 n=1 Tax=Rutidosis leptorrhynchoides TaxID=125765 RepID=UPI003A99CB73